MTDVQKILNNEDNIERIIDNINIELLMSFPDFNIQREEELYHIMYEETQDTIDYEKEMIAYYNYKDNQEGGYKHGVM